MDSFRNGDHYLFRIRRMKQRTLLAALLLVTVCGFAGAVELPGLASYDVSQSGSAAYRENELIVRFADPAPNTQLQEGPAITGPWSRRTIRTMVADSIVAGTTVKREYDAVAPGLAAVRLPEGTNVLDAFLKFNRSANVLYAEPDYKYKLFRVPNDPNFADLWGLDNTGQTGGTPDADIDAPEAWDIVTGNPSLIVAIIDTGVDYNHPDLKNNMWVNAKELNGAAGVDDDGNGYVDDIYGYDFAGKVARDPDDDDSDPCDMFFHGTHVAGTVGAVGNNSVGITGVCWNVKMMALKIFADDFRVEPTVFVSEAVEAIGYAVKNGAKVINASWGGDYFSQSLYDAIKDAGDAGLLFVAAAGNDRKDNDIYPVYPANFDLDNVISIMSTDADDKASLFSNYGASSVDIAEPGTDVLSTTPTYQTFAMTVFRVDPNYDTLSGTSMSAPYASGSCALIWAKYPTLPNRLVKGILLKTTDPTLTSPRLCLSGGRIDLYRALTLIPSGKAGKVLNTKDDPTNRNNLYSTIQQAIDDANNGDVLIAEAGTLFIEAIDFKGKAITLRSGNIRDPNDPSISPANTYILGMLNEGSAVTFATGEGPDTILKGFTISWGNADFGGGIRCNGTSPTISDCIISNNFAKFYGAGIDCYNAAPTISGCTIKDNRTLGTSGMGGGVNFEQSSPVIANCLISRNFADNQGGGIACYYANPVIVNCVIANNSAIYQAGGIHLEYSSPVIANCTVIVDDPNASKDGGIYARNDSFPLITNCILWGNGDDLFNCSATYSNIEDNDKGQGNIHVRPTFVTGPLGNYYLSQTAAGQLTDSAGLDLGNPNTNPALQMNTYTTRTDGVADAGRVDIGAHFPAIPAKLVQLDITVVAAGVPVDPNLAHGRVEPASGLYRQYEVVRLKARPNDGYRVKTWSGTDDDSLKGSDNTITLVANATVKVEFEKTPLYQLRTEVIGGHGTIAPHLRRGEYYPDGTVVTLVAAPDQTYIVDRWAGTDDDLSWSATNTVTMNSDKEVTVIFRRPRSLHVPGQYLSISQAIEAAYPHGDTILVGPGTYSGGNDFDGKAITIVSEHPDDPCAVAATIIRVFGTPAFIFQTGEGHDSVVDGFTIEGMGDPGPISAPSSGGTGAAGAGTFGGAISCLNGSSPTLANLVIKNVVARGQDGEDATFVFSAQDPAPPPLDPLDPNDQLPDPNVPDPADPNQWAPADPNRPPQPDPADPNASAPGFDGQNGAPGLPGETGAAGIDGTAGFPGGDGGPAYGGAMYFDANSTPIILNCTIINCQAIGGDGGAGGQGQDGGDGQDGQPGQDGQQGQNGGEGLGDGDQGAGGNGGNGGDGGAGGVGGKGGDGGKGGQGGEALGGAIYFGPNCKPTIRFCKILTSSTRQGLGDRGGAGGNGGNAGAGAEPGAAGDGGDGTTNGQAGADGASGPGGNGGDGGKGGDMGVNGVRSWAGAIFFGENCQVDMADTTISHNAATTIVTTYTYSGGDGGDGGIGGDGDGSAPGGTGGTGGDGGAGGPPLDPAADTNDPNISRPGLGGTGGTGGTGGDAGDDGLDGFIMTSYTTGYGGADYYDVNCHAELRDCTISFNASRQLDGGGLDGGGEYYQTNCTALLNGCDIIGNLAGLNGSGGGQYFNSACAATIRNCNYLDNSAGTDGGGLSSLSDSIFDIAESSFISNSSMGIYGRGGGMYAGGAWDPISSTWYNGNTVTIDNSYFGSNDAAFGGAMFWHGDAADLSLSNSVISGNTAEHGGGMFWAGGAAKISDCSITGNRARTRWFMPNSIVYQQYFAYFAVGSTEPTGGGGGLLCWSSDAQIENCLITGNSSAGSGGGVYFGGAPSLPRLNNCAVRGNTAVLDGGGIVSYWLTTPTISNCTIADNAVRDASNTKKGRGGGLACSFESRTTLINSIVWGNTAAEGNQLSLGSTYEEFYIDRPATLTVSYCDIQGGKGRNAVHVEPKRILNWLSGNINADPLFVGSSLNLSQVSAQQTANSPCIDAGNASAVSLGLDSFSTRSDNGADAGTVDMGFHYSIAQGKYQLTVKVIGGDHGTVTPLGGVFERFSVVRLQATADTGYQVTWIGTDDDASHALSNKVTMDADKTVTVEFAKHLGKTVTVPADFLTIQEAVSNANDGDTIVVDPGTYFGGYSGVALIVDKPVTIQSRNPDDPNSVAATIIDGYIGTNTFTHIGVLFGPNADSRTVLNGITIQNCGGEFADGDDGDRDNGHPNGEDGAPGEGGAILILNGASPIIKNCILRNNIVRGGDGGDGVDAEGDDPILNAGRGGWSGWAHGGAIYCAPDTSPKFINCIIENNVARGGDAGGGGDGGGTDEGYANYGGNWSRSQAVDYDPFSANIRFVPGDLWAVWSWDYALVYGPIFADPNLVSYFGDYRWYSGLGGGAYCDLRSNVAFINCEIRGNRTYGGLSGVGGEIAGTGGRTLEPILAFEMPSFGAGVYCAAEATVSFTGCTFENNVASEVLAGADPNHRLDPFVGYGGGVCARESASVVFVDCNFVGNRADSGGGSYVSDTITTIVDCNIANNAAIRGGGLAGTNSLINVTRTDITGNRAAPDANNPDIQGLVADGAGLYCSLGGLSVQDCNISSNLADFSGGGVYLRDVNNASLTNSLILNNRSGRDGGGISVNWNTAAVIANCTVVSNAGIGRAGEPNDTGFGGGLFCGYDSDCIVTDSIFWNNFARNGNAISVGSNFQFDPRPSRLTVSYSDIKDGQAGVWVDRGSTLHWGDGNINKDPLFTAGPLGDFYLSQTDSGQSRTSPAVDAGSDYTSRIGLGNYTTRTDEAADLGRVDVGFHHPIRQPCRLADVALDGIINFRDFAKVADAWLDKGCSKQNSWCQGSDLTSDTLVDFRDVLYLANCWLVQDTNPPDPNPSRWETEPNLAGGSAIRMTAETAIDAWGWEVEYFFDCIDDSGGCNDSGWQKSPTYTDSGLTAGTLHGYRVKTRDALGNEGDWSEPRYAGQDSTPPAPAPRIESTVATPTSIAMTATTVYDDSDVEYYFESVEGNGHDSGWQASPNYTDTGLDPNTEYSYRVRARDRSSNLNTTPWSGTVVVRTLVAPDTIPPTPNPMQWDPTVDPNGFDGTPRELFGGNGTFDYYAVMTAVVATDAGGGPVQYFFECTTERGFSSGWIATPTYRVLVGRQGQGHRFRVRARDQFGNVTGWSIEDVAD